MSPHFPHQTCWRAVRRKNKRQCRQELPRAPRMRSCPSGVKLTFWRSQSGPPLVVRGRFGEKKTQPESGPRSLVWPCSLESEKQKSFTNAELFSSYVFDFCFSLTGNPSFKTTENTVFLEVLSVLYRFAARPETWYWRPFRSVLSGESGRSSNWEGSEATLRKAGRAVVSSAFVKSANSVQFLHATYYSHCEWKQTIAVCEHTEELWCMACVVTRCCASM